MKRTPKPTSTSHPRLWEEKCCLKSVAATALSSPLFNKSLVQNQFYIKYEFLENSDAYQFKHRVNREHQNVSQRSSQVDKERAVQEEGQAQSERERNAGTKYPYCTVWSSSSAAEAEVTFNHQFECHFTKKEAGEDTEDCEAFKNEVTPCRILIELFNYDSWGRHNFLGYSYCDVPLKTGPYDLSLRLWAPLGTLNETLSSKFCGSALQLLSPAYQVVDDNGEVVNNRSFLKTQTVDGNVRVLLNVVKQDLEQGAKEGGEKKKNYSGGSKVTMDMLGGSKYLQRKSQGGTYAGNQAGAADPGGRATLVEHTGLRQRVT